MLSYDSQVLASARIGAAGVEKLCRDLQVDPSDRKVRNMLAITIKLVLATLHILLALDSFQAHMTISLQLSEREQHMPQVLLLAWKMGAQQMGFFSRSEFEQGVQVCMRMYSLRYTLI